MSTLHTQDQIDDLAAISSCNMFSTALIATLLSSSICRTAATKPIPTISEQFSLYTTEIDDTNNGQVTVHQSLYFDIKNRRSHMIADGILCQGHLEEINRCDNGWKTGWTVTMGGPPNTNASTWQCTNHTLDPSPQDCQFSPFFSFPSNASYVGVQNITHHNSTKMLQTDAWMWWETPPGGTQSEQWMFHTLVNTAVPSRIRKVYSPIQGFHLWHIDFTKFVDGPPSLSSFNPPVPNQCPPATPNLVQVDLLLDNSRFQKVLKANNPFVGQRQMTAAATFAKSIYESQTELPAVPPKCNTAPCGGFCDHYTAYFYGLPHSGYGSAIEHWNAIPKGSDHFAGWQPGALAFFSGGSEGYGHIAIGDVSAGMVYTTDLVKGKNKDGYVGHESVHDIESAWGLKFLGWTKPIFR